MDFDSAAGDRSFGREATIESISSLKRPSFTIEDNLEKRKQMLADVGREPVDFAYERAIGRNDSVYSNFCELIMLAKRKVGRIVIKDGIDPVGTATGFIRCLSISSLICVP